MSDATTETARPAPPAWGSGIPIPGTPFREVIATAQTNGGLVVLAVDMPVGEVVDEHIHESEDQITVAISGEVLATTGDDELLLTAGSVAFLPRGVPHSLRNLGTEPARLLDLYTPGGFERVFYEMGRAPGRTADGPQRA